MNNVVLVITKTNDKTADFVIQRMQNRAIPFLRINSDVFLKECRVKLNFGNSCNRFSFITYEKELSFDQIKRVWLRRLSKPICTNVSDPEARAFAEQEHDFALRWCLGVIPCPFLDKEEDLRRSGNKFDQLRVARQLELAIPDTCITNDPSVAESFLREHSSSIAKTIAGYGAKKDGGFEAIYTVELTADKMDFLGSISLSPVCLQRKIEKKFELRVTIVYPKVFSCRIDSQVTPRTKVDWRRYDTRNTPHSIFQLPFDIEEKLLAMMRIYNIHFAAFDLIVTPKEEIVFLEMNPNSQWVWIELLTGLPITDALIDRLVE